MTGVEAVSNGVPVFKEPVVKSARLTLTFIVAILIYPAHRDRLPGICISHYRHRAGFPQLPKYSFLGHRCSRWTRRVLLPHNGRSPARTLSVGKHVLR